VKGQPMSARRRDAESDKAILGATESACKACGVERQGPSLLNAKITL